MNWTNEEILFLKTTTTRVPNGDVSLYTLLDNFHNSCDNCYQMQFGITRQDFYMFFKMNVPFLDIGDYDLISEYDCCKTCDHTEENHREFTQFLIDVFDCIVPSIIKEVIGHKIIMKVKNAQEVRTIYKYADKFPNIQYVRDFPKNHVVLSLK